MSEVPLYDAKSQRKALEKPTEKQWYLPELGAVRTVPNSGRNHSYFLQDRIVLQLALTDSVEDAVSRPPSARHKSVLDLM